MARPLIVTSDPDLLDALLHLTDSAGVHATVAHDALTAGPSWATASVVLVDVLAAPSMLRRSPPPRSGVVLVVRPRDLADPPTAYARRLGADHVAQLPADEAWLRARLTRTLPMARAAPVVSVLGGRGGVGASVLAAAIAVAGRRIGHDPVLVDLDPYGRLDVLLGAAESARPSWPELHRIRESDNASPLGMLPRAAGVRLIAVDPAVRRAPSPQDVQQLLGAVRASTDLVVADLPRHLTEPAIAVLQAGDLALLIVPADQHGCAVASAVATSASGHVSDLRCVVRYPGPLGAGQVSRAMGLPVAGPMADHPAVSTAVERGDLTAVLDGGPLARLADHLLAGILAGPSVDLGVDPDPRVDLGVDPDPSAGPPTRPADRPESDRP
jgi:secretion/DNA translocation related CpaE-like protein